MPMVEFTGKHCISAIITWRFSLIRVVEYQARYSMHLPMNYYLFRITEIILRRCHYVQRYRTSPPPQALHRCHMMKLANDQKDMC